MPTTSPVQANSAAQQEQASQLAQQPLGRFQIPSTQLSGDMEDYLKLIEFLESLSVKPPVRTPKYIGTDYRL